MRLRATHVTRYSYAEDVSTCHTELRLVPRMRTGQVPLGNQLEVTPSANYSAAREDYFGNEVIAFSIEQPHRELVISSETLANLEPAPPANLSLSPAWEDVREEVSRLSNADAFDAYQFIFESPLIRRRGRFAAYAKEAFEPGRRFLEGVNQLAEKLFKDFKYDPRATTVTTPIEEALEARSGVCQDFAHVMIACLRSLSLPVRYVSGYIRSGTELAGADASHAWVSVWCPMFGWQDFDPTNNVMPQADHITLAWGRDYSDVAPVKGVALGGGEQVIEVSVKVTEASEE